MKATAVLMWLLAADVQSNLVTPGADVLLQYGAIGVVALIFIGVAAKLFNQVQTSHTGEIERIEAAHQAAIARADTAYDKEISRGDRLESELRELNRLINDKLAGELVRATDAIREAFETMHDRSRRP